MIFHGGRSGIFTVLAFLKDHVEVRISNTEWPAYLDIMTVLKYFNVVLLSISSCIMIVAQMRLEIAFLWAQNYHQVLRIIWAQNYLEAVLRPPTPSGRSCRAGRRTASTRRTPSISTARVSTRRPICCPWYRTPGTRPGTRVMVLNSRSWSAWPSGRGGFHFFRVSINRVENIKRVIN